VEGSAEYRALLAGLVVVRLLDKWRSPRLRDPEARAGAFAPVAHAVAALPAGPVRDALHALVESIAAVIQGTADERVARLIAYGQLLERDAHWNPAADVFLTAIDLNTHRELLPLCHQRASVCFRALGDLDRAADHLRDGQRIAVENGDQYSSFRLRISVAKLAYHKGDLPEAERLLDALIADADAGGSAFVASQARHDRGNIAYEQGHFGVAIEYFHAAWKGCADPMERERVIHSLGMVLTDLGHLDDARAVLSAIRRSGRWHEIRTAATINLMHVARLTGDRESFDHLRNELLTQRLPGQQIAHYHLASGQGYVAFDDPWKARREFTEAVTVAAEHGWPRIRRSAEELISPADMTAILADLRTELGE
jgi:tetratricopeptide (TPR) repeat protein